MIAWNMFSRVEPPVSLTMRTGVPALSSARASDSRRAVPLHIPSSLPTRNVRR